MARYFIVVLVVCGIMLWQCAGIASAGCCKGEKKKPDEACNANEGCSQKPCSGGGAVEGAGTVKAVDMDRDEVVISTEGAAEDVTVVVDRALAERLKVGDTLKLTYEKKCVNVATSVVKPRSGFKTPGPCTDKKI